VNKTILLVMLLIFSASFAAFAGESVFDDVKNAENVATMLNSEDAYTQAGNCIESGRYDKAIPFLKRTVAIKPEFAKAYFELGYCYRQTGEPGLAMVNFKKSIDLDPVFMPAYMEIAMIYADRGDYKTSLSYAREAEKLAPDDADVKGSIAEIEASMPK